MNDEHTSRDDELFEFDELFDEEPAGPLAAPAKNDARAALPVVAVRDELEARPAGALDELEEDDEHEDALPVAVAHGGLPPIVVPLLLVVALANLALVGLTWKSLRGPAQTSVHLTGGRDPSSGPPTPSDSEPAGSVTRVREPGLQRAVPGLASSRDDAWATIDEAERALDAGEFVSARRALYSMLTVIDRVEAAERRDLESRGSFLIAESYRRQARALKLAANDDAGKEAPR